MIELCYIKCVQKQLLAVVLQNRRPCKFCKIHRKLCALESLFNKAASKPKDTPARVFSMIFAKHLRRFYNKTLYITKIAYGSSKSTIIYQIK